ncbi:MAG: NAD(P)-binding domain-containing protein, partial [Rhodospirillales bacterium]|nr:NAD(P)-binding domain-containing protein [Rhodospirillales bacterium]
MKIGFIGVGIMGAPMAMHLIDGGHEVAVYDVGTIRQEVLDKGVRKVGSSKEAAAFGDVIIVMVPDTQHVAAVLFGENGVAEADLKGKIVVDMSSIAPVETKEFAKKINALGAQ